MPISSRKDDSIELGQTRSIDSAQVGVLFGDSNLGCETRGETDTNDEGQEPTDYRASAAALTPFPRATV